MWNLPRPGIDPVPPALTGRFLTTAPPGKSTHDSFEISLHLADYTRGKDIQEGKGDIGPSLQSLT